MPFLKVRSTRLLRLFFAAYLLHTVGCASKTLRPGESDNLYDSGGKKVGAVKQLSTTEREHTYDADQNGVNEKRWLTRSGEMTIFERFDLQSGKIISRSHYLRGQLNRVEVFYPDGRLRAIVSYPDGHTARSVELPERKKLVEFISR